jgi:predicted MFS family arabinose efflux permease
MLVNATVYVQYLGTLPLAVRDAGLAVGVYGALVALNGFIVITCELLVTRVVQRWPARIVVAVAFVLLGGGLACYALPWGLAAFVTGTLIWSLAEIIGGPTMFAYPAQAAPQALRGRYLGSAHAMFGLGSALGPVLGVAAWEAFGRGVWVACGLACLLGLAAALAGIRPTPPEPAAAPAADPDAEPGGAAPARAAVGTVADPDGEPGVAAEPRLAVSAVPSDAH